MVSLPKSSIPGDGEGGVEAGGGGESGKKKSKKNKKSKNSWVPKEKQIAKKAKRDA